LFKNRTATVSFFSLIKAYLKIMKNSEWVGIMKSQIKRAIAILLLVCFVLSITAAAVSAKEEKGDLKLTFGSNSFEDLKKSPNILAACGKMPSFENTEQRQDWLTLLQNVSDGVRDNPKYNISDYMYPKGPVVGYGCDINGTLIVIVESGTNLEKAEIKRIYNFFNQEGRKKNKADVPLVFEYGEFPELNSRTSSWISRGLIGGIKVCTEKPTGVVQSTLGFAAKTSSGTKGYVVAGHAAPSIGDQIWQPTAVGGNQVGKVTKVGGRCADASWVPYSNVVAKVYDADTDLLKDVKSYSTNPQLGWLVFKSGISTGTTSGTIYQYLSSVSHPTFGSLTGQYTAKYSSAGGDSGSPIYRTVTGGVQIVGIHWGSSNSKGYFSPIRGVTSDLGVTPLTR
jgi:hypothetical protein